MILAHFAGSPQHGMVYGHYYLAREWVKQGHTVTILAASYAHTRFKNPKQSWRVTESLIDGIRYIWLPTPRYQPSNYFGRVANILTFTLGCFFTKIGPKKPDVVICSSHHPFPIHAAKRIATRHKARLVFEVRDLWPLTLMQVGKATLNNPFIRVMQYSEDYAYKHAHKVVSVLAHAKDYMIEHGMESDKFAFIPNGVALEEENSSEHLPISYQNALNRMHDQGKVIIGYCGKMGVSNDLNTLLEATALSPDERLCVALLGDGSEIPTLKKVAQKLGIHNRVLFFDPVSKAQVSDFLARVDIAYLGLLSKPLFKYGVSPTKLNDYMLAAKPVICAINAPDDMVGPSGAGVVCPPENPERLSAALIKMLTYDKKDREAMGLRGRQWIEAQRDYRVLAKRFLEHAR